MNKAVGWFDWVPRVGWVPRAALLAVGLLFTAAGWVEAQRFTAVPPPPGQPMKEGFDTARAIFWSEPNFVPLRNPEWEPLSDALRRGDVADDTPVLTFEAGGEHLVLVSSQMAYHHVAQGEMRGEPWMVTF